jgi:transposase-like protein
MQQVQSDSVKNILLTLEAKLRKIQTGMRPIQMRYSKEIKQEVVKVLNQGISVQKLSQILKISRNSIFHWKKDVIEEQSNKKNTVPLTVRELFILPEKEKENLESAKIQFGNKICLEISMKALRGGLLRELMELGCL